MKKYFCFIVLALNIFCQQASSQKPASVIYFRMGGNIFLSWIKSLSPVALPAFNVTPGFRIIQGNEFTLALTLPVSAGISIRDKSASYFGLDMPLMLELDLGSASGNSAHSGFGIMFGAGIGYHLAENYNDSYYNRHFTSLEYLGYRFHTGISIGKNETGDRPMIIASFGRSFNQPQKYTIGLGFAFILGNRKKLSERE